MERKFSAGWKEREKSKMPTCRGHLAMELSGRLSNPDFLARIDRLLDEMGRQCG